MSKYVTRREVLASVGVGGTLGLAGCASNAEPEPDRPEQLWEAPVSGAFEPVVDGEWLYVAGSDGIHRIDRSNGEILWTSGGPSGNSLQWPRILADRVYATSEHELYCLDRETGETRWRRRLGEEPSFDIDLSERALCVSRTAAGVQNTVTVRDPVTGDVRWRTHGSRVYPHGDTVWVAERVEESIHSLRALDPETGEERWGLSVDPTDQRPTFSFAAPGSVLVRHGTDSEWFVTARDRETGERRWRVGGGTSSAFSVEHVRDGTAFIGSTEGHRAVDVGTGERLWKRDTGFHSHGSVFVGERIVYGEVRDRGPSTKAGLRFRSFDIDDGEANWATPWRHTSTIGRTAGSPGMVCVDTVTDGLREVVACFNPDTGERRWVLPDRSPWTLRSGVLYAAEISEGSLVAYS